MEGESLLGLEEPATYCRENEERGRNEDVAPGCPGCSCPGLFLPAKPITSYRLKSESSQGDESVRTLCDEADACRAVKLLGLLFSNRGSEVRAWREKWRCR